MKVFKSIVINAPLGKVWAVARDFVASGRLMAGVTRCELAEGLSAETLGCVRYRGMANGSAFREVLVALSDAETYLRYEMVESPLPMHDFVATLRFYAVTEGGGTFGVFSAEFDTADAHALAVQEIVSEQICAGTLHALKLHLET